MNDQKKILNSPVETNEKADNKPEMPAETPAETPKEIGGRQGPEPTRYGDWENNGIASDF